MDSAQGHAQARARRAEETALREVVEETGLDVRITGPLDSIEYTFVQSGTRIHKTVHYFMMEPIGGDLDRHDHEFDQVRWVDFDEATTMLTFETERALVAHAADLLAAPPAGAGFVTGPDLVETVIHETPLASRHEALGARMIDFAGWRMPVQYALDPRGASCGPRTRRPVRPLAHGRAAGRRCRRRRGAGRLPSCPTHRRSPSVAPTTR